LSNFFENESNTKFFSNVNDFLTLAAQETYKYIEKPQAEVTFRDDACSFNIYLDKLNFLCVKINILYITHCTKSFRVRPMIILPWQPKTDRQVAATSREDATF
jgi:hypothetical protein